MAIVDNHISVIYDGLINKFLYKNDADCIHILLNMFDLEDDITNIRPKYITTNRLKNRIYRYLKHRKDRDFISLKIGEILHEDINRLELFVYLKAYKEGYFNKYWTNKLEKSLLLSNHLEDLYSMKYIYQFGNEFKEVKNMKSKVFVEISKKESSDDYLEDLIREYSSSMFKFKILNLNKFLDKQLVIDYDSSSHNITEEEELLRSEELNDIYEETVKLIFKTILQLYKDAYWHGLNDSVLKRYR